MVSLAYCRTEHTHRTPNLNHSNHSRLQIPHIWANSCNILLLYPHLYKIIPHHIQIYYRLIQIHNNDGFQASSM